MAEEGHRGGTYSGVGGLSLIGKCDFNSRFILEKVLSQDCLLALLHVSVIAFVWRQECKMGTVGAGLEGH